MSRMSRMGRRGCIRGMSRMSLAQGLGWALMGGLLAALASAAAATDRPLAAAPADTAAGHQATAIERAAVERRFTADQLDCQQRFQVSDCLTRASAERRQAMHGLQQQTQLLDDAKRRQKATQRLQQQQQRQAEAAAQVASAAARPQQPPARTGQAAKAGPTAASAAQAPTAKQARQPAASQQEQRLREQQRLAQYNSRVAAAKAHQQALETRNANQQGKRPVAAALPVPVASSPSP